MSKHTPGPWKASGFADVGLTHPGASFRIIWSPSESMDVAYAAPTASPADEALLAAAPELLAALERIMRRAADCVCSECEQAHAAIKKAKGEA